MLSLIPFIITTAFVLLISSVGIYIGIRYIKNNGFKKNRSLGIALIVVGSFYFISSLASYLLSNLTGNTGGWLKPIAAFLFMIVTVPLGILIKEGK